MRDKGALLFCKIAVAAKYITQAQANECLGLQDAQADDGLAREIGEVLVERGYMSKQQVEMVLDAQRRTELRQMDTLFGKMAVDNEFASEADVKHCLELQKEEMRAKPPKVRPLGQIMKQLGLLTAQQVQALLKAQGRLGKAQAGDWRPTAAASTVIGAETASTASGSPRKGPPPLPPQTQKIQDACDPAPQPREQPVQDVPTSQSKWQRYGELLTTGEIPARHVPIPARGTPMIAGLHP